MPAESWTFIFRLLYIFSGKLKLISKQNLANFSERATLALDEYLKCSFKFNNLHVPLLKMMEE